MGYLAMTTTHKQRIVRRAMMGLAVVVLALVLYIAGAPIVGGTIALNFPAAVPYTRFIYAPLSYYIRHPELPGSSSYKSYAEWCAQEITKFWGFPPNA